MNKPWLYRGAISHHRFLPKEHSFSYPALFICFPLQEKSNLRSRFFGLNHFNIFSFHEADHGDGKNAQDWIRRLLETEKIKSVDGDIHLLCMPRILGFVFNPVSFWFCHDKSGSIRAVLCEVNNTFGERHYYLLQAPDEGVISENTDLQSRKAFHVSPFFPVNGQYKFRFEYKEGRCASRINYEENEKLMLRTALAGKAQPLTDNNLVKVFFSFGWATLLVVLRIHWQALLLWLKGIPFHRKPSPPVQEISR